MIDIYAWKTPNGYKPLIAAEELGLEYHLEPVNLGRGEQKDAAFLAINPNGKIPALVDGDRGIRVFESGAILWYLAEREGRLLPEGGQDRALASSWLHFQMANVGPMLGQAYHFRNLEEKDPYGEKRYTDEARRVLGVLDGRLAEAEWLAGDAYTIADIATFPWVRRLEPFGIEPGELPFLEAWIAKIAKRPAVERAYALEFG